MIADFRSDTVTKPTQKMLDFMYKAPLGDDVFGEDPSITELEKYAASLFGMEAGLFCPSGTMTNQIAIKLHTQPGDEVICDFVSHIYQYEGGGIARNAQCSVRLINGAKGQFTSDDVLKNINPDDPHYPRTKLVSVENTCNRGGGSIWSLSELKKIRKVCDDKKLKFHLDGARIFNALEETKESPKDFGKIFDTISVCLSKGLGAPVGSVLLGSKEDMYQARRIRKVFGGGMRQAGIIAAGGLYALKHQVKRLSEDHDKARELEKILRKCSFVKEVFEVESNIVVFILKDKIKREDFIQKAKEKGVLVLAFGANGVRMVTHLDISKEMMKHTKKVFEKWSN